MHKIYLTKTIKQAKASCKALNCFIRRKDESRYRKYSTRHRAIIRIVKEASLTGMLPRRG